MSESKIENWLHLVLKNKDFNDYEFSEFIKTQRVAGFFRNMFFVTVKLKNKNGDEKVLDLVIKASQENENLRQKNPVQITFCKEIFVYEKVHKTFAQFQNENTTENLLDFLPRCYATQIAENSEVLIFENLQTLGFRLWDKTKLMDFDHLRIVMEALGRWHAFSFALKSKNNGIFQELIKDNINMLNYFCRDTKLDSVFYEVYQEARNDCVSSSEEDLLRKTYFSLEDVNHIFSDFFSEDLDYSVILHGDCHSENYMFGYDEHQKVNRVRIIDWQCSGFSSPVIDLSQFLYPCCDIEKYPDVLLFLKIYYNSLSQSLESLGCDSKILYPFSKLEEHWVRFSRWGIFLQALIIKFVLCETREEPDFGEIAKQEIGYLDGVKSIKVSDKKEYCRRVRNNLIHYAKNLEIAKKC